MFNLFNKPTNHKLNRFPKLPSVLVTNIKEEFNTWIVSITLNSNLDTYVQLNSNSQIVGNQSNINIDKLQTAISNYTK